MSSQLKRLREKLITFFLEPASARPLAALRIGVSAILLLQAFEVRQDYMQLFSSSGIVQGALSKYLARPLTLDFHWFVSHGFNEPNLLLGSAALYICALLGLILGVASRGCAAVAFFFHSLYMNTGHTSNYGADVFAHCFLFYLMFVPAGDKWALSLLWSKRPENSAYARLGLRVIQLHLCIAYLASAIEKMAGPQWWNGEVIWRALSLPVYVQYDMSWLAAFPWLCKLAAWGTLVVEGFYCVFIWPRQTRGLWIALTVSLHAGIAAFMGLNLFGYIMIVLTVSAFGFSAKPALASVASPAKFSFRPFFKVRLLASA